MVFGGKKKSQIEELMSVLVSEPVLELAKAGHDGPLETLPVDFVFVLVSHPQAVEFHRLASQAIQIGLSERAMLVANAGGLLQFAVGPVKDEATNSGRFVSALAKALGASARIVYGSAPAHVGTIGTEKRKTWGFHPVTMEAILSSLLGASPGEPLRIVAI